MENETNFYAEAFSRNRGLLTEEQQEKLRQSTVAIAGLGGAGGVYASTFARLGFGRFHIADLDNFELGNMNRQAAANVHVLGRPKVEVVKEMILSINPYAQVTVFDKGVQPDNVAAFLENVTVAIDAIDFFSIEARRVLYQGAREHGVFVLAAGPIGYGSSMLVYDPRGMSFDEYMDIQDGMSKEEMLLRFGLGTTPTLLQRTYFKPDAVNWKDHKAPSLVTGTLLCANLVSCEALKIVFGEKVRPVPASIHFDPYLRRLKLVSIPGGNKNPLQRLKRRVVEMVLKSRGKL